LQFEKNILKKINTKSNMILAAVIVLGSIGALFGLLLYVIAQKFKVIEDPKIDEISEVLPGANCGGCGKAGCRALAEAIVKQGNTEGLKCPAGGNEVAAKIAKIMGLEAKEEEPVVAVIRCSIACSANEPKSHYQGMKSCFYLLPGGIRIHRHIVVEVVLSWSVYMPAGVSDLMWRLLLIYLFPYRPPV
jgi:Na+-translocating ferredoxin:NAD+ oxidoreductase RNF subunit RnfB